MSPEQLTISYDQFMPQPRDQRIQLFNEVSAENRALLIRTHGERWLDANHRRLTPEQIAIVEEIVRRVSPEWYREGRDMEKVHREVEGLRERAEAVLLIEDLVQILSNRADYVPRVGAQS